MVRRGGAGKGVRTVVGSQEESHANGASKMQTTTHKTWQGTITAVDQHPQSCRITIELPGYPAETAGLMKESIVAMEVLEPCEHDASG